LEKKLSLLAGKFFLIKVIAHLNGWKKKLSLFAGKFFLIKVIALLMGTKNSGKKDFWREKFS